MSDPAAIGADDLLGLLWSQLVEAISEWLPRRARPASTFFTTSCDDPANCGCGPREYRLLLDDSGHFAGERVFVDDPRVRRIAGDVLQCRRCRQPVTHACLHDHCKPYLFPPYLTGINRTLSS